MLSVPVDDNIEDVIDLNDEDHRQGANNGARGAQRVAVQGLVSSNSNVAAPRRNDRVQALPQSSQNNASQGQDQGREVRRQQNNRNDNAAQSRPNRDDDDDDIA